MSNATITHDQRMDMHFWIARASKIAHAAREDGVIITIELAPRLPLAMGNYDQVVDARPKRVVETGLTGSVVDAAAQRRDLIDALQKIGNAVGLIAGDDITTKALPAVYALLERVRLAEEVAASMIQAITTKPNSVVVLNGADADDVPGMAKNIARFLPPDTLGVVLSNGASISQLDEEQMRENGWVRAVPEAA